MGDKTWGDLKTDINENDPKKDGVERNLKASC